MKKGDEFLKQNEKIKSIVYSRNKVEIFMDLPREEKPKILIQLSKKTQGKILKHLNDAEISSFLKILDLDEAVDILQVIEKERRKRIVSSLEKEAREKINLLLKFEESSVAGLMTLDYIEVDFNSRLKEVLALAEKHERRSGKFPIILVMKKNQLEGELLPTNIPKIKLNDKILNFITKVPYVKYNLHVKEVPKILKRHSHEKLVVVDKDESILGIVYAHDVLKLIDETRGIGKFAGVKKEEDVYDSILEKTRNRYKWLIVNLATAFLAASVVGLFEDTIAAFTLLAIYMPVVAGMGGNAGTQTLAVFVRGIALKEIALNKRATKAIFNEVGAGALNGLITGVIAALIAILWNKSPMFGLIIGLAMIINLVVAGFFGALIPLTMEKMGKDPATSATVFITTATDVLGFFAFLGLAALLL